MSLLESKNKQEIVYPPKDDEELELEKLVFGDLHGFESSLKNADDLFNYNSNDEDEVATVESDESEDNETVDVQDDQLFFVDEGEVSDKMDIDEGDEPSDESESSSDESDAWYDSADDEINISLLSTDRTRKLVKSTTEDTISGKAYISRLRSQFEKIYPRPIWADARLSENEEANHRNGGEQDSDLEEGSDSEGAGDAVDQADVKALLNILQKAQTYQDTHATKLLPPQNIDITRLKDANEKHGSKSGVQTLSFHPTHPLLLTGGFDRTIRVYHIDGKHNNVVTTIHLRDTPINTAQFNPNHKITKIYAGGRRRYMFSWDLQSGEIEKISRMYGHESTQRSFEDFKISPKGSYIGLTGNSGWINILSSITSQWIKGFKIEGTLVDFDWSREEDLVVAVNSAGEVWEFDFKTAKVITRWKDETGIGITKVRLGGKNNRWCAVGSKSGIVNVYDRLLGTKKPFGVLDQLVTSISTLEFTSDGQILCIGSRAKKDALRLVQLPSCKVFQNWPTSGTPLGRVTAVKFSPNNEVICIANEAGKARLWRLNHY